MYASLISKPDGRIVSLDLKCSNTALNLAINSFNQLYDYSDPADIMHENLKKFISMHPLKVVWEPW